MSNKNMRGSFGVLFVILIAAALSACGGGDGGSSSSTVPTGTGTATIQGAVPGTVFMAVNNDTNLEAGRVTATGTPKTFSMVVPTGANYRFYVMENEGNAGSRIYPMYMGSANVFELDNNANGQVISLGMVGPDLKTGRATPANTPPLMLGRGANTTVPAALTGTAFLMDDMKGTTWGYNTLMTSGTMGWEHGTLSFDASGLGHMSNIVRNGSSVSPKDNIPYTMSMSGMLLDPDDNTFQCVVSGDMSVMVGTFTDGAGGPALMIAQKRGGTYPTDGSDMTGIWRFQRLTAGNDNLSSGWAYGTMTFVSGSATITSMTTNAGVGGGGNISFSMDAGGIMTRAGDTSFHGVMSIDKTMIVATDTSGSKPELWVMMKTTAPTFSSSDMVGDWVMHSVSSGNPGSRDWTFGHSVVDANGNNTFYQMMGSGGPISPTTMTMAMNSDGGISMGGSGMGGGMMGGGMITSTFHGFMNDARNMMVSSYSDGSGGYPFSIQVK